MASDIIEVRELSRPAITRVLKNDFRDESGNGDPVNITGYTFKLIVKQSLELEDARAYFDLSATLSDAVNGEYTFTLTLAHTCLPAGDYPGEIRWWTGATTNPPDDAIQITFRVLRAVDNVV